MGLFMAFLEFGPMPSLNDNFEPVQNFDYNIVVHIIFPYGTIYGAVGAGCGICLWFIFSWVYKQIKARVNK
ncbi:hypothetical protein A9G13_01780 [Gilliamella sp. wkB178]|nr:hypothetical protein A9G13_01780 [Gilliamella apicola]